MPALSVTSVLLQLAVRLAQLFFRDIEERSKLVVKLRPLILRGQPVTVGFSIAAIASSTGFSRAFHAFSASS